MKLKPKQKEDLARAALRDGLIFAWDTGLGKTLGSYLWSLLKVGFTVSNDGRIVPKEPVLVVAPGDGFEQWRVEGRKLRIDLAELDRQETFLRLSPNGRNLGAGFYFSSFSQLTRNGVKKLLRPEGDAEGLRLHCECSENIGESRNGLKCVYSPTLADLCSNAFACVVVDEGVHIKGTATLVGEGIRRLNPRYRLIATATPIKNRLPDIFWLAWWATGGQPEGHARWPFAGTAKDQTRFAETFLMSERNLTRETKARMEGRSTRYAKFTASVCNVHGLWKLFAPVVLRRRKEDMDAQIPPKIRHVIRVPMGTAQAAVYQYHLQADYRGRDGQPAMGAKLQALRIAAANPGSLSLAPVGNDHSQMRCRSSYDYTPKLAYALSLICRILKAQEQVIVFSAFQSSLDGLAARLHEASVPHMILDGRMPPKRRGILSERFKHGAVPVLLAGLDSMAEMHSFPECSNAILMSYSWAWDKFEQAINRIHRINSPKPVHIHSIVCEGSIDRKLEEVVRDKGDSSELVIDGKLPEKDQMELDPAELVAVARQEFKPCKPTVDERTLECCWPFAKRDLQVAAANYLCDPTHLAPVR